jgi:membrane-associated phospholipid phosphatase
MKKENSDLQKFIIPGVILFFISIILTFYFLNIFFIVSKFLVLIIIIGTAVLFKKSKIFLKDWFVFLSFLYLFDSLRGLIFYLICKFDIPVYVTYVIKIERALFGSIPSIFLQNLLLDNHNPGMLEKFLTVLYGTHFLAFLVIGFMIWNNKPEKFSQYKISFYLLISVGIAIYFLVPTAPPWIASKLFNVFPEPFHFNIYLFNLSVPDLTAGFDVNPVAAMPSLHTAFPALCSFLLWHIYRWKASAFYLYSLLVFFTIIYTGDHYVVDIIAGIFLAFLCYIVSCKIQKPRDFLIIKNFRILKKGFFRKYKYIIIGMLLLILGVSIGTHVKIYFKENRELYETESAAPNYVDFFNHIEKYKNNYYVQYYYANHLVTNKKYEKALFYYHRALDLSENSMQKHKTLQRIYKCKILLNKEK